MSIITIIFNYYYFFNNTTYFLSKSPWTTSKSAFCWNDTALVSTIDCGVFPDLTNQIHLQAHAIKTELRGCCRECEGCGSVLTNKCFISKVTMTFVTLNNGAKMPMVGLGTWRVSIHSFQFLFIILFFLLFNFFLDGFNYTNCFCFLLIIVVCQLITINCPI